MTKRFLTATDSIFTFARAYPFVVVGLIFAPDLVRFNMGEMSLWSVGALDEPAHAATASLLLAALVPNAPRHFILAVLVGSVALDIDHLPLYAGLLQIPHGMGRPETHSLLSVYLLVLAARMTSGRRRPICLGLAFGFAAHLLRDLFTGYVPLFWPVHSTGILVPYPWYVIGLGTLACYLTVQREHTLVTKLRRRLLSSTRRNTSHEAS